MVRGARIPFVLEMVALMIIPFEEALRLPFGSVLRTINITTILLSILTMKFKIRGFSKSNYLYIVFIGFFGYAALSGIWASYHQLYFDRLFTYFLYLILILVLNGLHPTASEMRLVLHGLYMGGLIVAILLVFGKTTILGSDGRHTLTIFGRYIDPNLSSYSLVVSFVINQYMLFFDAKHVQLKSVIWILQLILAVGIVLLGSRGSFICVMLVSAYMLYIKPFKKNKVLKRFILIAAALAAFLAFYILAIANSEIAERFTFENLIGKGNLGTANRYTIWNAAFKQFAKRPLFGYGNGASPYVIQELYIFYGTHNTYIMVLLEFGVVGFALYLLWIALEFKRVQGNELLLYKLLLLSVLLFIVFFEGLSSKVFWGIQIVLMLSRPLYDEVNNGSIQGYAAGAGRVRIRWGKRRI